MGELRPWCKAADHSNAVRLTNWMKCRLRDPLTHSPTVRRSSIPTSDCPGARAWSFETQRGPERSSLPSFLSATHGDGLPLFTLWHRVPTVTSRALTMSGQSRLPRVHL